LHLVVDGSKSSVTCAKIICSGVFPTLVSIKLEGGDVATCSTLDDKGSKLSKHEDVYLMCAVAFLLWRFLFPRIAMAIRYYDRKEDD
jgi:hypothetical protein